jgi:hypothetical protein
LAAVSDGAAALVVGRGGGIEPGLVACLPDADHNKMRAHGHASDLPERTPRDPSLHLTAPYAIPPLSCGNTLHGGAARGAASWPLPPDTEGVTGSNPVAPTTALLSRAFADPAVPLMAGGRWWADTSGRRALPCLTKAFTSAGCRTCGTSGQTSHGGQPPASSQGEVSLHPSRSVPAGGRRPPSAGNTSTAGGGCTFSVAPPTRATPATRSSRLPPHDKAAIQLPARR